MVGQGPSYDGVIAAPIETAASQPATPPLS